MPTPDYPGLKAEIAKPDYAGMDDAAVAAALNAPGAPTPARYPVVWLCQIMSTLGLSSVIEDNADDKTSPVRNICLSLRYCLLGVGADRDVAVDDPNFLADLDSLVSNGKMTADQRQAIVYANAQPGPSIANGLGFPSVTTEDLAAARSL